MDEWMDDWNRGFLNRKQPVRGQQVKDLMKTDVREHEHSFEVDVELPGFKKDEIKLSLESGYLNISVAKTVNNEEKEEKTGKIIRQERYSGAMSRSFYVGDDITEEDIKAKLDNGVLCLTIPKKEAKPVKPEKKMIAIEG